MTPRAPAASGAFYDSRPRRLAADIRRLLTASRTSPILPQAPPFAYIVPHAAYVYSGRTAAAAYRILGQHPANLVILIGPLHDTSSHAGPSFLLPSATGFTTPLGTVPVDAELRDTLLRLPRFRTDDSAHASEHCLEVQLPFLQHILPPGFRILPILTTGQDPEAASELGQALLPLLEGHPPGPIAVVTTTDLSRFHPHEATEHRDRRLLHLLGQADLPGLVRAFAEHRIEACGALPLLATLRLGSLLGHDRVTILDYTLSSAVSRDRSRTVGYASAIIT